MPEMHLSEKSTVVTGDAFRNHFVSTKDDVNARLDLGKLRAFLRPHDFEWVSKKREHVNRGRQYPSERDVKFAFEIYCKTLRHQNVEYTYNSAVAVSPFNPNFKGSSDCLGRSIGFLQLLAVLGVPLGWLHMVTVGGLDDGENKILRSQDDKIVSKNVYRVSSEREEDAPNALKAELKTDGGKKVVQFHRTVREPFANHNVAKVVGPVTFRYWDPLLERAYRNSTSDFFDGYEKDVSHSVSGCDVVCYRSPAKRRRRLYYLPRALGSKMKCGDAFAAVSEEMGKLGTTAKVCLIVDEEDWPKTERLPEHPPVVEHILEALQKTVLSRLLGR